MTFREMIEEARPGILWWKFANLTERALPWRWSQALRHGPHNIGRRLRGLPVTWIGRRNAEKHEQTVGEPLPFPPEAAADRATLGNWEPSKGELPS